MFFFKARVTAILTQVFATQQGPIGFTTEKIVELITDTLADSVDSDGELDPNSFREHISGILTQTFESEPVVEPTDWIYILSVQEDPDDNNMEKFFHILIPKTVPLEKHEALLGNYCRNEEPIGEFLKSEYKGNLSEAFNEAKEEYCKYRKERWGEDFCWDTEYKDEFWDFFLDRLTDPEVLYLYTHWWGPYYAPNFVKIKQNDLVVLQ